MGIGISRLKKSRQLKSRAHKKRQKNLEINSIVDDDDDDKSNVNRARPPDVCEDIDGQSTPERQPKQLKTPSLLDTSNFDFRIEPVEKLGNQLSQTHYFLIEEPKYRRCHSTKDRCNPIELYANSSRLFNQYNGEPTLPFEMNEHITSSQIHNSLPIRRGRSDTTDYLYNQQRCLIARMRLRVPQATDIESHGVLMGTNWNFAEAERRLKMELVHRQNGANYKQCESILMQHNWNLDAALKSITSEKYL